jgi:hypothetical protein
MTGFKPELLFVGVCALLMVQLYGASHGDRGMRDEELLYVRDSLSQLLGKGVGHGEGCGYRCRSRSLPGPAGPSETFTPFP